MWAERARIEFLSFQVLEQYKHKHKHSTIYALLRKIEHEIWVEPTTRTSKLLPEKRVQSTSVDMVALHGFHPISWNFAMNTDVWCEWFISMNSMKWIDQQPTPSIELISIESNIHKYSSIFEIFHYAFPIFSSVIFQRKYLQWNIEFNLHSVKCTTNILNVYQNKRSLYLLNRYDRINNFVSNNVIANRIK